MATARLPDDPSFEQLRKQAKAVTIRQVQVQQNNFEIAVLLDQLLRRLRPRVSAGAIVHRDEAVHAGVGAFPRPLRFGDVVVHEPAYLLDALHHPAGIAERGDEEADAFLERDPDPFLHSLAIVLARLFDQRVETDRLAVRPSFQRNAGEGAGTAR